MYGTPPSQNFCPYPPLPLPLANSRQVQTQSLRCATDVAEPLASRLAAVEAGLHSAASRAASAESVARSSEASAGETRARLGLVLGAAEAAAAAARANEAGTAAAAEVPLAPCAFLPLLPYFVFRRSFFFLVQLQLSPSFRQSRCLPNPPPGW